MVDRRDLLSAMQQDSRCRQLSGGGRQGGAEAEGEGRGGGEGERWGERPEPVRTCWPAAGRGSEEARKCFLVAAVVLFVVSSRRLVCDAMRCHDVVVETLVCRMQKNGGRRRDR